jgi:hypothetical protein
MAKKQKSFADKAAGSKDKEAVYVKYVKSVKSDKTGQWRFNEQMIRSKKGEQLDVALKRMDEVANLVDIDLSQFEIADTPEVPVEDAVVESNETVDETIDIVVEEQTDTQDDDVEDADASNENSIDKPEAEESPESGTEESEDQSVDSGSNDETSSDDDASVPEENKPEKEGEESPETSD